VKRGIGRARIKKGKDRLKKKKKASKTFVWEEDSDLWEKGPVEGKVRKGRQQFTPQVEEAVI